LTISRELAAAVNNGGGLFTQSAAESLPDGSLFALRYGKICDNAYLMSNILLRSGETTAEGAI
jgi:hypothetical protein